MEHYTITGMSCAACQTRVEKAVSKVDGVSSCSVSLLTNSMVIEGGAAPEKIIAAVNEAGYGAVLKDKKREIDKSDSSEDELKDTETPVLKKRLLISLGFLLVLMYLSMGHAMWGWPLPEFLEGNPIGLGLMELILSFSVMIINKSFFTSGFKSLMHLAPNMDSLVALGSAAAFSYSTFVLFAMTDAQAKVNEQLLMSYAHDFYFETAAMILTLITVGKMLEARSKGKTTDALKGLMKLSPKTATIVREGVEITIPTADVQRGDVFVVRPGENVPVDGIVNEGSSSIDESMLTGESIPVDKAIGSTVSAGTINQEGFIKCTASRVGEDTTLSQIIQMVSDAAATKAPIAKIADKVSGVFVPVVIGIAVITTGVWLALGQTIGFALARGISVLVISCPCALGLATPVAIMVGSGIGAKNGILFKTAVSLEKTGKAGIIALDKTGTITRGEPAVTDLITANKISETELLSIAYALESKSEHPLAKAVVKKAEEEGLTAEDIEGFKVVPGSGLMGILKGETVIGGNFSFVLEQAELSDEIKKQADSLSEEGKTPLYFSKGKILCGIIAVADTIKEDSPSSIKEMKSMGLHVVMLTGDNERTARAIGEKAGVDEVIAGVLPADKENVIKKLKEQADVIMVGDGINDAPALTCADVGIAIGAGSDVAIDAADVVLMKSHLSDVPAAIRLSKAVLKNIHQNLFWAFIYNIIGIPLAAGLFIEMFGWKLNPMFGAAAMSLSSFCVVTNALRLNLFNIHASKGDSSKNKKSEKQSIMEKIKLEKTLRIEGMMCGHCEMHVKKALEKLEGVKSVQVSHVNGTAVVELSENVSDDILKQAVTAQDYQVTEIK